MRKQGKISQSRKGNPAVPAVSWRTRILSPPGISLALALATLAVFWSVRSNDFINLDDQVYVTDNAQVQGGLNWANFVWAFTNLNAGFWHPLTWLSIMLDCQLFGLRAGGHHLTSLLLHTTSAVLLFIVLRRMTAATWRSAFVAALFALHPLHVEPVAWAADRKDVLSTVFWLLTMLMYVRHVEQADRRSTNGNVERQFPKAGRWYAAALFFFVCAVMSKTMVVTLPLVLLLLDWWPLRRFQPANVKRLILEKAPFLVISLVAGLLTVHAERGVGALPGETQFPLQFRVANAILSCCRYLAQLFWPNDLAVFYPYPEVFPILRVAGGALLLVMISVLALWAARKAPYLPVGWFWFLVTLLPVIGLIQVGAHARADRYTYVPLIGIFMLLTWGACDLTRHWRNQTLALSLAGMVILLVCAALTNLQLAYWKNSETMFRHALQATRNNYMADYCLGDYLSDQGKSEEAIAYYQTALQINPTYGEACCNLGIELAKKGNLDEAITNFRNAIRYSPRLAGAHSNLGNALDEQGKWEEAIGHFREALKLDPNNPQIRFYFGYRLAHHGNREEALTQYQEALRLKPDNAEVQEELSKLTMSGKP